MASSLPASPIELLNLLGAQVVVIVSGGGTQVIPQLLAQGGLVMSYSKPLCRMQSRL